MIEDPLLSLCQHDHDGNKDCICGKKAKFQFRTFVRPFPTREYSIAYSIYLCAECSKPIRLALEDTINDKWTVKISIPKLKRIMKCQ